ncbi:DNA-directed RNA polymerase subunit A' [Methanopyrus sp.]
MTHVEGPRVQDPPKYVKRILFGILPPDKIRKMSKVEVTSPETYDEDGYPIEGGVMDTRMGVIDPGLRCRTCGQPAGRCPGHFGHIELARPVLHPRYAERIKDVLRATCPECGRVKLPEDEIESYLREVREGIRPVKSVAAEVVDRAEKRESCPHCGAESRKITYQKPTTIMMDDERLWPVDIRAWLEKIPDGDVEILGFHPERARPEWAVLTVLPVPPVTMRPSIILETGERAEDDLTHKLVDIVRVNLRLKESLEAGAPEPIIEDQWDLLQYHVTTYIDNEIGGVPVARHRTGGKPLKGIVQRLKGKEGRFRQNLAGKRVNFSARSVITPDPELDPFTLGVPEAIAKELTVPERVTEWNIDRLRKLVLNGPNKHPGANYVVKRDGSRIRVTDENKEKLAEELEPGDVVERHLMDGDPVMFNRQPTLHIQSELGFRVRVMPGRTFRLPAACYMGVGFNADFDGDEMNLHVPQSEEARAEVRELMGCYVYHLWPPKNGHEDVRNSPIHEAIVGIHLLSRAWILLREAYQLLEEVKKEGDWFKPTEVKLKPEAKYRRGFEEEIHELEFVCGQPRKGEPLVTGRQLLSVFLPDWMDGVELENAVCPDDEEHGKVVIEKGRIVRGFLDEKTVHGIMTEIVHRYATRKIAKGESYPWFEAAEITLRIMDKIGRLGLRFVTRYGFTLGIDEFEDIYERFRDKVERLCDEAAKEAKEIIERGERRLRELEEYETCNRSRIERGEMLERNVESEVMAILNQPRVETERLLEKHRDLFNPAYIMPESGARGSITNIARMALIGGQQAVMGERPHRAKHNTEHIMEKIVNYSYTDRVTPHFEKSLIPGVKEGGFVRSGFFEGLDMVEYFLHAMSGREGLIDKGFRTADSGYLHRRYVTTALDLIVDSEGRVRDSANNVIQLTYGEDGIDPAKKWGLNLDVGKALEVVKEVVLEEEEEE